MAVARQWRKAAAAAGGEGQKSYKHLRSLFSTPVSIIGSAREREERRETKKRARGRVGPIAEMGRLTLPSLSSDLIGRVSASRRKLDLGRGRGWERVGEGWVWEYPHPGEMGDGDQRSGNRNNVGGHAVVE